MKERLLNHVISVSLNMGDKLKPNIQSALIADFPAHLDKGIFDCTESLAPVQNGNKEEKRRYVNWGKDNRLPVNIMKLSYLCAYVAPAEKHIIDNIVSSGVKPFYKYYKYENGTMKPYLVDFEAAGELLENRIRELEMAQNPVVETTAFNAGSPKPKPIDNSKQIEKLRKELEKWTEDYPKVKDFLARTNSTLDLQEKATDAQYFGNWFPTIELNIGLPDKTWEPEIVSLNYLEATNTRKGEMDKLGEIPYVVYSRAFGGEIEIAGDQEDYQNQIVIPALDPRKALEELQACVKEEKDNKVSGRTIRYCLPMRLATPGKPYYACPAWHSIFKSGIYYYLIGLLSKRANRLANGTMFSYIVHLNDQYVNWRFQMANVQDGTQDEKTKVYNELIKELTDFIASSDNDGKALIAMMQQVDGKPVKWVEIEEIDRTKSDTTLNQDIAEIANVLLFAQGVHGQTVGALPGKDKVASGTEARELTTLLQLNLYPIKMLLLVEYYLAKNFNNWTDSLVWDIPLHVLTTLDKNKKGVEEMSNADN